MPANQLTIGTTQATPVMAYHSPNCLPQSPKSVRGSRASSPASLRAPATGYRNSKG